MWELWKRRNARRHGKGTSFKKMYYQCQLNVHYLIKVKFPQLRNITHIWQGMFHQLKEYRPILHYLAVKWTHPQEGWVKCNTDGASKGNPEESSYGFCIRDSSGDLLYAEAKSIGVATNMEAETMAIWKALQYCINHGFSNIQLETDSLS
ncbi:hypothetical protein RDI58_028975 [Solanum bulbocastanum]|uniref:RNase H type-1 domain-containing protein n=1 Tax=Solanum bulbocastanum TaxID=147425 RepID=A0AAN8STK5_SOLBU